MVAYIIEIVDIVEIMTVMVCLIAWIAITMAMEFPIARTGARTTLTATNHLPLALMRASAPNVVQFMSMTTSLALGSSL